MASESSSTFDWEQSPPSVMDIVAAYFPESNPKGALRLRPCLVLRVLQNVQEGLFACEVAFGTKNLKTWSRLDKDIIIQNSNDLDLCGLPVATRFDMDPSNRVALPRTPEFYGCWSGRRSPRIGSLPTDYQKDVAFILMKQIAG
jgi:hypothetical protein